MKILYGRSTTTALMFFLLCACVEREAATTPDTSASTAESDAVVAGFGTALHVSAAAVTGGEGDTTLKVDVRLTPRTGSIVTVDYMTTSGSARVDEDFAYTKGQFTFTPGRQSHIIEIPVIDDDLVEEDETFILKLHVSEHATLDNSTVELTITDNDG